MLKAGEGCSFVLLASPMTAAAASASDASRSLPQFYRYLPMQLRERIRIGRLPLDLISEGLWAYRVPDACAVLGYEDYVEADELVNADLDLLHAPPSLYS